MLLLRELFDSTIGEELIFRGILQRIFAEWTKNIHWGYGLVLAGGMALGGWFGAKFAVKGGEKAIRIVLIAAILIMASKLLGLF